MIKLIYKDYKRSKFLLFIYTLNIFTVMLIMAFKLPAIYKGDSPLKTYNLLTILCFSQLLFLYLFTIKSNLYELIDTTSIKFIKSLPISSRILIRGKYLTNLIFLVGFMSIFILGIITVQIISGVRYNLSIFMLLIGTFLFIMSLESFLLIGFGKKYWNFSYLLLSIPWIINIIKPKFISDLVDYISNRLTDDYLIILCYCTIGLLFYFISFKLVQRRYSHYSILNESE
ncbi:hypothetical protein [Microaceticoccus formicicus]|uniref:hypothetical protein n=1 Tax=Microaceticoccus formicicus TaxID=3118105 RepID=UPI003CD03325|nr:hypothetical protein VZL98_03110 [Peptoniphilaceae bacterium AMB_02]